MPNQLLVDPADLSRFTTEIFERAGMPREDAEIEADVLVWANLRGVDSHGVLRIPWYVKNIDDGVFNLSPNIEIEKETAATLLIEGDRAFGPVVTVFAMSMTIEKAREAGVCWTIIRNTTHQGAMAYYSLMATEQDMAGIAVVCSPPNMATFGSKGKGVHNSPIAIAVPAAKRNPPVLDMATSVVAGGKLSLAQDKGESIPPEWSLDPQGNPTTTPSFDNVLLPFAGPKGSGLALMFATLSNVMVANPCSSRTSPVARPHREACKIASSSQSISPRSPTWTNTRTTSTVSSPRRRRFPLPTDSTRYSFRASRSIGCKPNAPAAAFPFRWAPWTTSDP